MDHLGSGLRRVSVPLVWRGREGGIALVGVVVGRVWLVLLVPLLPLALGCQHSAQI